ncbi:fructosamine kinase family protein [Saccharicrinis sp. FJH54]|uniref:fructosamine kinase family protein n=1 Tax=Saccharicrinis sp. FJH54 TaxID=3344665 RepID=UPI0035D40347
MKILNSDIVEERSLGGGCIANARRVKLANGKTVFVKSGTSPESFRLEANGLKELRKAGAVRIPEVLHYDENMLVTEFIEQGPKQADFYAVFGRQFARLHQYHAAEFGFFEDNYIGATPQPNIAKGDEKTDWTVFYFNKRLKFQFNLALTNGYGDHRFQTLFSGLEDKISEIIGDSAESPTLLHGDLWGGNYMVDPEGNPVLIDPAVYYGHREADLAMTKLFGGFSPAFYAAYLDEYPLKEGWEYRENMYKLYHILNHLNLFGSGYYSQAIHLMEYYV